MAYLLGIDIGTSGCKCVLLNGQGDPISSKSKEYNPIVGVDGTAEQDPNDWYAAVLECLNGFTVLDTIDLKEVTAIGVTGQMQGITLIGSNGEPVRNSILWNDFRAVAETSELNRRFEDVFSRSIGFPSTPSLSVSKIEWLKNHEPESWAKTDKFTFASNFISYKLTGRITADENNITLSGLNDVKSNNWSEELISICEVEKEKVPELTGCFDIVGTVTEKAARETGLKKGTPVVAGGGDAGVESYSVGIAGKSKMKIRLGSASALNTVVPIERFNDLGFWPGIRDVMRDYLLVGIYTSACALSIKWIRDVFYSEREPNNDTYSFMDSEAETVPLGSDGLLYHPYLSGESAPYNNPDLRAKFNGINAGHRRKHFLRAAYEGVSFSIRDAINATEEFRDVEELVFIGGGTKSKLWISILADVLGKSGLVPEYCDAAYGAALMAGQGTNIIDSPSKIESNMKNSTEISFNSENHARYNDIFARYMEFAGK
ncbi:MAG: hypothetical protein GY866_07275 [Proteobacteria bacterium]|nr:hypothetical protein [Pseudomonadota bacterium]